MTANPSSENQIAAASTQDVRGSGLSVASGSPLPPMRIIVSGLTADLRETLIGAEKWLRRIHDRKDMLPASFLDNCDPKPLADKIRRILSDAPCDSFEASDYENTLCARCGHMERDHKANDPGQPHGK